MSLTASPGPSAQRVSGLTQSTTPVAASENSGRCLRVAQSLTTPKPVAFLKDLLSIGTDPSSLVLDLFGGSGSLAHAIQELNAADGGHRRIITIQIDEETDPTSEAATAGFETIADLCKERIRRVGAAAASESPLIPDQLDIGFRVLVVDTTNMADVLRTPDAVGAGPARPLRR